MREIKFRAWDGEKMHHEGVVVYLGEGFIESPSFDSDAIRIKATKEMLIIEQYTGLTDKNGVEIYEGDKISDHVGIGIVEYVERHAAFRVNYNDGQAKWFYDYSLKGEARSIEVIGNSQQRLDDLVDEIKPTKPCRTEEHQNSICGYCLVKGCSDPKCIAVVSAF